MKLIPPQIDDTTQAAQSTEPDPQIMLDALQGLNNAGTAFSTALEEAYVRIHEREHAADADALTLLLLTSAKMANIIGGGSLNGYTGSDQPTSGSSGKPRRGRPRKVVSGTPDRDESVSTGESAPKRGRGRPKGSKNKSTLKREAVERKRAIAARVAKRTAKRPVKQSKPKPVVRTPARASRSDRTRLRQPASARKIATKGKAAAGRKKSSTAHSRQRGGARRRQGAAKKAGRAR